jgi:ABC-2 type transport system permease protein
MVKRENKKTGDFLLLANGLLLVIVLNQLASFYFFRLDLTEEKRYTIKAPTKEILKALDDDVYIEVFLEGDLNAGFKRLRKGVRETLEEFRTYSQNKVHFTFVDPSAAKGQNAQQEFMADLASKGIQPMNVIDNKDGKRTEKLVFPGALISYAGAESGVMLLKGNRAQGSEEVLNQSIEGLEFEFINAIERLTNDSRKKVGLVTGHGELDSTAIASLRNSLLEGYHVSKVGLDQREALATCDLLMIIKPTQPFSDLDKYHLDQYLLRGGKLLLMIDRLEANMDSASRADYFAFPYPSGLEDQLFHYGVRINNDLVQDLVSLRYPVVTGNFGGKPQMTSLEWPFFPMVNHYADHAITRNLDASAMKFVSSMDSVKAIGIKKTPLLFSSQFARKIMAPVKVSVNDLRKEIKPENFSSGPIALAYLLEGKFTSVYKNRFLPNGVDSVGFLSRGKPTRMIVVADGDLARNEANPRSGQPQALGFDSFSGYTFANEDLIMNMVSYLIDDSGLIGTRNKEVKVRPLNKELIRESKTYWQVINLSVPLVLIVGVGLLKVFIRKRKFARFS